MSEKEKSRPAGSAAEAGRGENAAFDGAAFSIIDFTTTATDRQPLRVSDVLCRGQENAQTMRELRKFLNGDSRSIRLQIEHERRSGCPIVSDQHGWSTWTVRLLGPSKGC